MSDAVVPAVEAPLAESGPGLLSRVVGILFAPRKTYAAVAARPRVLGALALAVVVIAGGTGLFVSSQVGRDTVIEMQTRQAEAFGRPMTEEQLQNFERVAPYFAAFTAVSQIVVIPIMALVVAGLMYALFTAILGGDGTYKQTLAVVAHAGFVLVAAQFFVLPLDYIRESLTSPTSLAVFLPFLEEMSFLARLLGAIDLVYIWWFTNLAIGLGVLYKRRTGPIACGLLALYGFIALLIAMVRTALSGA